MSSVSFGGENLAALSRDALAAAAALKAGQPAMLARIGNAHAEKAREIVRPMSRSIPPTIVAHPRGPDEYVVEAGGPDVPLAAVFEKAKGSADEFRHPLFGDRNRWYDQFRVRFMSKARAQLRVATTAEAARLLDRTAREHRFPTHPLGPLP